MTEEKKKKESGEISRREFLKDAGLIAGGAAIGSTVLLAACGPAAETETVTTTVTETVSKFICPYDSMEFDTLAALQAHLEAEHPGAAIEGLNTLVINGETHFVKVQDNWSLAYVLREKLNFTGSKVACLTGECGACTVIMDGRPVLSCLVLAVEADGKAIETIEGLAGSDGVLHPLQTAFIEKDGLQCGFCTPAMIMNAKALLDVKPNPTAAEVREALAGTLCRCGAQPYIVEAVLAA